MCSRWKCSWKELVKIPMLSRSLCCLLQGGRNRQVPSSSGYARCVGVGDWNRGLSNPSASLIHGQRTWVLAMGFWESILVLLAWVQLSDSLTRPPLGWELSFSVLHQELHHTWFLWIEWHFYCRTQRAPHVCTWLPRKATMMWFSICFPMDKWMSTAR